MTANRFMSFGGDVRCIGEWRFEGGGFVCITVGGSIQTKLAIEYVEMMLALKKEELAKIDAGLPTADGNPVESDRPTIEGPDGS